MLRKEGMGMSKTTDMRENARAAEKKIRELLKAEVITRKEAITACIMAANEIRREAQEEYDAVEERRYE